MTTTTHRERESFPIEAGATRQKIVSGFADATLRIEQRAKEQGRTEILWDMIEVSYRDEEVDDLRNLFGGGVATTTQPPAVLVSVPVVVTS